MLRKRPGESRERLDQLPEPAFDVQRPAIGLG